MAYDRGMTKIWSLIDIFDKRTDKKIVRYLGKKYLRENVRNVKTDEARRGSMYDTRMIYSMANVGNPPNFDLNNSNLVIASDIERDIDFYYEAEVIKPESDFTHSYIRKKSLKKSNKLSTQVPQVDSGEEDSSESDAENIHSKSTNSLISGDLIKDAFRNKNQTGRKKVVKKLSQNILNRIKELKEPKRSFSDNSNEKSLKYYDHKINMSLKKPLSEIRPSSSISMLSNPNKKSNSKKNFNIAETIDLNSNTEIEIREISRLNHIQAAIKDKIDKNIEPLLKQDIKRPSLETCKSPYWPNGDLVKSKEEINRKSSSLPGYLVKPKVVPSLVNFAKTPQRLNKLNPLKPKIDSSLESDFIYNSIEKFYIKKDDYTIVESPEKYIFQMSSNFQNLKFSTPKKQSNERNGKKNNENVLIPVSYLDSDEIKKARISKKVHFSLDASVPVKTASSEPQLSLESTLNNNNNIYPSQYSEEYLDSLKIQNYENQNFRPIIKNSNTSRPVKLINLNESK